MRGLLTIGICLFLVSHFSVLAALPDWVLNPPTSDEDLYAVGQGKNLQESEQAAVKNILGQLRTRIDSSLRISQQAVNQAFKETIEQSVNARVENFPISQYQILNRHQDGDIIYTQAKVSKSKLGEALFQEVKANQKKIEDTFAAKQKGGSTLEWWVNNKEALLSLHAANQRYTDILTLLGTSQPALVNQLSKNHKRIADTAIDNCLFVKPTQQSALQQALRKQVINLGLPADREQCSFQVSIKTSNRESQLFGKFTSSLTMTTTLLNGATTLSSSDLVQTGQSISNQQMANKASLALLVKRLENNDNTINLLLAN
jgi:hypothetical protein